MNFSSPLGFVLGVNVCSYLLPARWDWQMWPPAGSSHEQSFRGAGSLCRLSIAVFRCLLPAVHLLCIHLIAPVRASSKTFVLQFNLLQQSRFPDEHRVILTKQWLLMSNVFCFINKYPQSKFCIVQCWRNISDQFHLCNRDGAVTPKTKLIIT